MAAYTDRHRRMSDRVSACAEPFLSGVRPRRSANPTHLRQFHCGNLARSCFDVHRRRIVVLQYNTHLYYLPHNRIHRTYSGIARCFNPQLARLARLTHAAKSIENQSRHYYNNAVTEAASTAATNCTVSPRKKRTPALPWTLHIHISRAR